MPFGVVGWTGSGMRQVVGFGDRSTGRDTLGANLGRAIATNGDFHSQRRGPLPKLLWADLLSRLLDHCAHLCGDGQFGYRLRITARVGIGSGLGLGSFFGQGFAK